METDEERRTQVQEDAAEMQGRDMREITEKLKRLGEGTKPDLLHVQRTERREPGNAKVKDLLEIDEAITRMKDHANLLTIRDL